MDDLTQLFTQDLTNVDLTAPLLVPGPYTLTVCEMKLEDNKDKTAKNIVITLQTKFAARGTKGETFQPGRKLYHYVSLMEVDKNNEPRKDRILQDLKRIRLSAGLGGGSFGTLDSYIGRDVDVVLDVESDKNGVFGDKNVIKKWVEKKG
jgi:hypothetical protein